MPRPRKSRTSSDSFNLRWHSISNTTTPSADIMSSPDPLTDPAATPLHPNSISRRPIRTQQSGRLASRSVSPRKQTFELEVGDDTSPQRLYVTVQSEETSRHDSTRRRLFPSSSPAKSKVPRGMEATTTVVPLRQSIEDEHAEQENPTPRKRGRPRKSNGTPMPKTAKRKRPPTPIKPTPRQSKAVRSTQVEETGPKEDAQITPTPKRRGRPPKSRPEQPSSETGFDSTATKRPRRRRQAMAPEELAVMAEGVEEQASSHRDEDDMDLIHAPSEPADDEPPALSLSSPQAESDNPDSDIWMATMSDKTTPRQPEIRISPGAQGPGDTSRGEDRRELSHEEIAPEVSDNQPTSQVSEASLDFHPVNQDNDTVAHDEDFSMIFADSIPSLQASFNGGGLPPPQGDLGEETSHIINMTLESLRQSRREEDNRGQVLQVPKSGAATQTTPELPTSPEVVRHSHDRISLSPGLIRSALLSRTPKRADVSPLRRRVMRSVTRSLPLTGRPMLAPEDEDEDVSMIGAGLSTNTMPLSLRRDTDTMDAETHDDSFSEVPEAVLEAAAPEEVGEEDPASADMAGEDQEVPPVGSSDSEFPETRQEGAAEHASDQMSLASEAHLPEVNSSSPSNAGSEVAQSTAHFRSDTSKLPTPDDTPPSHEDHGQSKVIEKSFVSSEASISRSSPVMSGAILPETALERQGISSLGQSPIRAPSRPLLSVEKTPANQLSSPLEKPASLAPETSHERSRRPTLSPIVRAGLALQHITSDPPSPEPQEPQLRSPFRSSTSKDSGSTDRNAAPIASRERSAISSPHRAQVASAGAIPKINVVQEDPFSASVGSSGQRSFMQALGRSRRASPELSRSQATEAESRSIIRSPVADEMSWVADTNQSNVRQQTSPLEQVQEPTAHEEVSHKDVPNGSAEFEHPAYEEDTEDQQTQDEEEETDIWEIEASRQTPQLLRQEPFGQRLASNRRRAAIPSPWTKTKDADENVVDIVDREEDMPAPAVSAATRDVEPNQAEDDTEGLSMLAQHQTKEQSANNKEMAKGKSFDLSSFFSSPAAIPGMLAAKTMSILRPQSGNVAGTAEPTTSAPLPTNSLFPSLPQQQFRPTASPRRRAASPVQTAAPEPPAQADYSSSPVHGQAFSKITTSTSAQRANFMPRQRQASQSFFQSPAKDAPVTNPTPPRMQLSRADIRRWQKDLAGGAGAEVSNQARPLLRPLPPKNASPAKSSLRSPLKPHTPGRVVEFTSSVLSPADQARARSARRMGSSLNISQSLPVASPRVSNPSADGKENQQLAFDPVIASASAASDITMTEVSPAVKPISDKQKEQTPLPTPLSQTVWSRNHWLVLDELLQLRRRGPFDIDYDRTADKYLGKTVKSQGEAMRLERWHLDCVDAFVAEVGGWNEAMVAKRVFALLLGEERRRTAALERDARVMFH